MSEYTALSKFLGKKIKLVLVSNFILYGEITEILPHGIMFKTNQIESYIGMFTIQSIKEFDIDEK